MTPGKEVKLPAPFLPLLIKALRCWPWGVVSMKYVGPEEDIGWVQYMLWGDKRL